MGVELLNLKSDGDSLGVLQKEWRDALAKAEPDPVVSIRHAEISGDSDYRLHVAAIPERVGCHVHRAGLEQYAVVSGRGRLHWGKVDGVNVAWEKAVDVKTGDSFDIPEGYAHQLEKTGEGDLTIVFGCPDSHLDDEQDRQMLADAPGVAK